MQCSLSPSKKINLWINMHIDLPEKRYYSIGEVAKAFNVQPSLLRFWEKEFKEIQPKKKASWNAKVHSRKYFDHSIYLPSRQRKGHDPSRSQKTTGIKVKFCLKANTPSQT